ncbi:MAG: hypothetical protein GXY38_09835 [Planctomycetes bacterium]|jgi:hemerythrin superfamily protein|nr:hypothetical protein [Planctomycetota bacterium]
MDIFSIIKSDHKKVQDTLESMLDTSSGDEQSRRQFTDQLRDLLLPHMSAEEALLYPLLMEEGDPELAMEAIEEHRTAKHVLSELESLSPGDAFWHARCQVLSELIEHHIDEEESDIFENASEFLDKQRAQRLAREFEQRKQTFLKEAA